MARPGVGIYGDCFAIDDAHLRVRLVNGLADGDNGGGLMFVQASKQLLKGLGSDTPQQLSLRQQMEQRMIAKFNRAVAPPAASSYGGYPAYSQMQQAPQMPNQQLLAGAFGGNAMQQVKAQANPSITRMMAME